MYKSVVFCDHSNFQIAIRQCFKGEAPKLDYNHLFENIVHLVPNTDLMRTLLFIPRPSDEYLEGDSEIAKNYQWESDLNKCRRVSVIEGDLRIYSKTEGVPIDLNNKDTYVRNEKGVDISLAINALKLAYVNAYDMAFVMSADSDYINLYKALHDLGKLVCLVVVDGQNINRVIPYVDEYRYLKKDFFEKCTRK